MEQARQIVETRFWCAFESKEHSLPSCRRLISRLPFDECEIFLTSNFELEELKNDAYNSSEVRRDCTEIYVGLPPFSVP